MFSHKVLVAVGCIVLLGGALYLALLSGVAAQESTEPVAAPATMPDGWQELDAAAFSAAARKLLTAKPGPEAAHVKEVTRHAWSAFLGNEQFIASGDWLTVRALLSHFVRRRNHLVEGDTTEAREASQKQVNEALTALQTRLRARMTEHPETLNSLSFDELSKSAAVLLASGLTKRDRADWAAAWMGANDWSSLDVGGQAWLHGCLNVGRVKRGDFGVRWTGTLRAPADGEYTFEQLRTYYTDGRMKLWIDGQLVLDSPGGGTPAEGWVRRPVRDDPRFKSAAVSLRAGEPATFRLDYVHNMKDVKLTRFFPMGFPMAVLTWQSPVLERQIVPAGAFAPPEGAFEDARAGLLGEYYDDSEFKKKMVTQLDAAVDFIWDQRGVCPVYPELSEALYSANAAKLTSPTWLASQETEKTFGKLAANYLRSFVHVMPASRRIETMRLMTGQPALLKKLAPYYFSCYFRLFHMLPGEEPVALLAAWSEARPQPCTVPARFRPWHRHRRGGAYGQRAFGNFWGVAILVSHVHFDDTEALWKSHLELPNGDCNLTLAYTTVISTKLSTDNGRVRQVLDEFLADEDLTGDQRATWLFARAYAEEVAIARQPRPGRGDRYLEEALAVAQSPPYRFRAFQELLARRMACHRWEEAGSLIQSVGGQFTDEAQKKAIAGWLELVKTGPAAREAEERLTEKQSVDAYVAEIRVRAAKAEARGDDELAQRYQGIVEAHEAAQQQAAGSGQ